MTYSEKLKDPRWQKKRLEILGRDEWTCRGCGDKKNTLNVHHTWYEPKTEPWEASNEYLLTLCDECHNHEYRDRNEAEGWLLDSIKRAGVLYEEVISLSTAFDYMAKNSNSKELVEAIRLILLSKHGQDLVIEYLRQAQKEAGLG